MGTGSPRRKSTEARRAGTGRCLALLSPRAEVENRFRGSLMTPAHGDATSRRFKVGSPGRTKQVSPGVPMPRHRIEAEAVIDAPAAVAYAIIADYREGHPHILPRPPFVSLDVEEG